MLRFLFPCLSLSGGVFTCKCLHAVRVFMHTFVCVYVCMHHVCVVVCIVCV